MSGRWEVIRSISSRGNRALLVFCNVTEKPYTPPRTPRRKSFFRCFVLWLVICVALIWSLAALTLLAARWIDPPTTAVHIQRRLQAWIHHTPYHERYKFIPLSQVSPDLQHAVLAAEDARFYQHHGFDWHAIQLAAEEDMEGGRMRGGSTITQQLVKNLILRNRPLFSAQGRGVHPGADRRSRSRQVAHFGNLSQRGRVGSRNLWRRVGVSLLRQNLGPEYRQTTGGTARGDSAGSPEATSRAHE